jgi:hypothetical protein
MIQVPVMQNKNLRSKNILSRALITLGIIGYMPAIYFLYGAIYFWIDGNFIHTAVAEDQPGGLDGLGFILMIGAAIIFGAIASAFFVPGILLRSKIKEINGQTLALGTSQTVQIRPKPVDVQPGDNTNQPKPLS